MTAVNPSLAARIAELGVPLSADWVPSKPLPSHLAAIGQAGSEYERALYAAYLQAMAEVDTVAARAAQAISNMGADLRATTKERDRYRLAWQSARFRAQAYSEGILRVVSDREQYQVWLKQAEAKLLKLQYGCETPESHLYSCSCEKSGGAS